MKEIAVTTRPATREGRLYPRYDDEADILVVESKIPREWPLGVDIDGTIVFDIDQARVLASFDLHVGRRRWRSNLLLSWPAKCGPADLVFEPEAVQQKSFNLPLRIEWSPKARLLRIGFGEEGPTRQIALSDRCVACVSAGSLRGFFVREFDE
jgi:hypothetical protein